MSASDVLAMVVLASGHSAGVRGRFGHRWQFSSMEAALDGVLSAALRCAGGGALDGPAQSSSSKSSSGASEAVLCAHKGHVVLDVARNGECTVTHMTTCEQISLPASCQWRLEYDDEDFAVCVPSSSSTCEPIMLEDIMSFELYEAEGYGFFIAAGKNKPRCAPICLRTFMKNTQ